MTCFKMENQMKKIDMFAVAIPYDLNIPVTILNDNRTLYDGVWDEPRYSYTAGLMAVDDVYVKKYNLPQAQKWPWDTSKSIYMLQGWHSMHCVVSLQL